MTSVESVVGPLNSYGLMGDGIKDGDRRDACPTSLTRLLRLDHLHLSGGRVINDLRAVRCLGNLGDKLGRDQFVKALGVAAFLRDEHLDGLVQLSQIHRLLRKVLRRAHRAQVIHRRADHVADGSGGR